MSLKLYTLAKPPRVLPSGPPLIYKKLITVFVVNRGRPAERHPRNGFLICGNKKPRHCSLGFKLDNYKLVGYVFNFNAWAL